MSDELPPLSAAFRKRYTISRQLGAGGMGGVYLAHDEELNRPVAIKFLHTFSESRDSLAGQRFEEEARVCAQLKHPRIVGLYALAWEGPVPYLVFEYVPGESLASLIHDRERLTIETTVKLGIDLFTALAAAHELGVVHRDVKPANLLVRSSDGRGMLADFGLARSSERTSFQTAKNLVLGTPAFMAPEVLRGEPAGPAADLYGAGCTLYACLTGMPPFVGDTDLQTMEMQLKHAPPPLEGVPAALSELVMALLAKDASQRPASAAHAAAALAQPAVPPDHRTRAASRPGLERPRTRERPARTAVHTRPSLAAPAPRTRYVAVAAVALCGVALGAWWWAARGRVIGPRVVVTAGQATITWETPRDTVGRVIVREDVAGGKSEDLWENAPVRMHSATVQLKVGVPHVAQIVLAGDRPAWSARFTPPPPLAARLSGTGPGAARVTVTSAPPALTLRLAGAQEGETIASASPGVFEVRHAAATLSPGLRLEQPLADGVIAAHPVDSVRELATRLAAALEGYRPGPTVAKLVMNRAFDPWLDFGANLGGLHQLASGDLDRKAPPKKPDYYPRVLAVARELPFWADVEAFRPEADGFFSEPSIPDAAKLHLYRGLLKLEHLDQICAAQHDPRNLHVRDLYAALVAKAFVYPAPPAAASLLPLTSWCTADFYDWDGVMWWVEHNPTVRALHPALAWKDATAVKALLKSDRTVKVEAPAGAGGAGTAVVAATVLGLGPSYQVEIALTGAGETMSLLLTQPGTAEWFVAMDTIPPNRFVPPAELGSVNHAWGRLEARFPARLLQPGPLTVRVSYQHVPGVRIDKLANIQRLLHVRDISISVNSSPR